MLILHDHPDQTASVNLFSQCFCNGEMTSGKRTYCLQIFFAFARHGFDEQAIAANKDSLTHAWNCQEAAQRLFEINHSFLRAGRMPNLCVLIVAECAGTSRAPTRQVSSMPVAGRNETGGKPYPTAAPTIVGKPASIRSYLNGEQS